MTGKIIKFPKTFQGRVEKTKVERPPAPPIVKKPAPRLQSDKTGKPGNIRRNLKTKEPGLAGKFFSALGLIWFLLFGFVLLFWPVISFLFWIDILWHGLLVLAYMTKPHTHYGRILLEHFLVYFILNVVRCCGPKGT